MTDLQGKCVLVTGGAGFIGSHIIDLLIEEGCGRIIAIDNLLRGRRENLGSALAKGPVELIEGDICDEALLDSLVAESDFVMHQAALRITHCAELPRAGFDVMAKASFNLLESCVRHKIKRIVAASSASVYGLAEEFPTNEKHHPYDNRTFYGAAKLFLEGMLRSYNDIAALPYVALRYFNVYGSRMDIHGKYTEVLVRWMDRINAGQPPIIFGDGTQTMDFVHVKDVARANILALRASANDRVYNVGVQRETSLLDLAKALLTVMGRPDLSIEYAPQRSVNPVPRRLADIGAAERDLGYKPAISLEEGLQELVGWWRTSGKN